MGHMTDALPNYRQQPDERSHNLPRHQPPSGHPSGMRSPQHFPSFATQAGLANPAYHVPYSPQYPPFPSVQHGMSPLPYLPQQHPQHAAHQHGMDMSNPHQQAYQHPQFYGGQQAPSPQYPAYPPFYRQLSPTQPEFSSKCRTDVDDAGWVRANILKCRHPSTAGQRDGYDGWTVFAAGWVANR
jgi:hypothetical protein